MFSWQKLFKTPTFWIETIQNDLFGHVEDYLAKTGKSKQDFANDLGVSKGYVSQILNGHFDHKLSKLVELYLSIGMAPVVIGADLNAYVSAMSNGVSKKEFIRDICIEEKPKKSNIIGESYIRQEEVYRNPFPMGSTLEAPHYKPQMRDYPTWVGSELTLTSTLQNTAFTYH